MSEKILIGNEEWCGLPGLGIPLARARIDTGAQTSALHASEIEPFRRDGADWISFRVHPLENTHHATVDCEAKVSAQRGVKNTGGQAERRYVILTDLELGGQKFQIELTLADRTQMEFRVLVGRSAMAGRMLVDPGASCLHGDRSQEDLAACYGPASE